MDDREGPSRATTFSYNVYRKDEPESKLADAEQNADEWDVEVTEESEADETDSLTYEISYYPADITIESYETRHNRGNLRVPKFQRKYVWDQVRASKLIESFLLGLPVPGVFLYKERKTNDLLIVDGQQRIMSAVKFMSGRFDDNRVFRLKNVRDPWNGKLFEELSDADQNQLRDTVLRATIIQQLDPQDDSSIYHIFERLNTGGIRLNAMEVRKCVFEGRTFDFIEELNTDENWRKIIGKPKFDIRLRDSELVLRILALTDRWRSYEKPMKSFLNGFLSEKKRLSEDDLESYFSDTRNTFAMICEFLVEGGDAKPFHLRSRLNYAILDSFMAAAISKRATSSKALSSALTNLKSNVEFVEACTYNTSDESVLAKRFEIAESAIEDALKQD